MSDSVPWWLSLPEEFALLSHTNSGKVHDSAQTAVGCAAAELGELALRRKLLVRSRKSRKFGFEVYRDHGEIQLLDTGPTGLVWADELMAELGDRSASERGPVTVKRWLRQRGRKAFTLHRTALTARGVLRRRSGGLLGRERHYPDTAVRDVLIDEVRAAYGERRPLDEHMLFLCDLVEGTRLSKDFRLTMSGRQRLDRARGAGAAGALPEDLRDTSTTLGFLVSLHGLGD
ncbi:GPP34 family phosphoprotein [Streptosporangium sp. NPDC051022]|uniref:GOLPH3/VPS74 family protein n=1 Tax=Streptosporangium sp. NPDC051022 TaxID=3155752 RepID=UPI00343C8DC2